MTFATRADLLNRSNARRLFQLAVPADRSMLPEAALRLAVAGGDLTEYSATDRQTLDEALAAIDQALADADALLLSYGIPATVQTTLLARLASTIALYYLQGAERMTKDVQDAYDGVERNLKAHARGELSLIPAAPGAPQPSTDLAIVASRSGRYGQQLDPDDEVGL